jgi:glycerol-3-phosphate acyltransferase PlsY
MQQQLIYLTTCFFIGSIPFGELLSRLKTGKSMIQPGSRTTVAPAQMFELLGIPLGILICLLDFFKGFLVSYPLAIYFLGETPYSSWGWISLGGLLTVIGHCNSIFLGFKGGRGLSPTFGVMATLLPIPAIFAFLLGLFLAFWGLSTKPGALSAAGAMPLLSIVWVLAIKPEELFYLYIVAFMSLWTFWEHRDELKSYMGIKSVREIENNEQSSIANSMQSEEKSGDEA